MTLLDNDPIQHRQEAKQQEHNRNLAYFLEFVPLVIIVISLLLRSSEKDFWLWVFTGGGLLATVIYVYFSVYFFQKKGYGWRELTLALLASSILPLGLLGIIGQDQNWNGSFLLLWYVLRGGIGLCFLSLILFVFHFRDENGSRFYRKLLARLLVFLTILLQIVPNW